MEQIKHLIDLAMAFYVDEPCRVCGKLIQPDDLKKLVFAGYSKDNKSRSAHGDCWKKNLPKETWVYPDDEM